MYKNILLPIDLEHHDQLGKAVAVGADLAKHYGADITVVGVTTSQPSGVARTPEEFKDKLEAYASEQSKDFGISFGAKMMVSHDPTIDIDDVLQTAAAELDTDLVVMASHVPGLLEHVFASRAGHLAAHADISVMVVR